MTYKKVHISQEDPLHLIRKHMTLIRREIMQDDHVFYRLLDDENKGFSGWDFSYISDTGRVRSSLLSWSYASLVIPHMQEATSMLDMGTGGGEFLAKLGPYPRYVFATEGYGPNVTIAKDRQKPLVVRVIEITDDHRLPFHKNQFDLVINQHESYEPSEIVRITKPAGIFLTQQVGGTNSMEINEAFGVDINSAFGDWNLTTALAELDMQHFEVISSNEEYPVQRFYDVGDRKSVV